MDESVETASVSRIALVRSTQYADNLDVGECLHSYFSISRLLFSFLLSTSNI